MGVAVLLAAPTAVLRAQRPSDAPRNVVIILSDDHRYDFMGFMERAPSWLETPSLDRMAAEGAHVRNAFVTTALCSPSRASIMTGQYAHRHGVVDNSSPIPEGTVFFPTRLQQAGYRTAFIGKWHMGEESDAPQPGFDYWASFRGQGTYTDPLLNINGEHRQMTGYTTDLLTDLAVQWLDTARTREPDRPFFLVLSHKAVHAEFVPAPRHAGRYADSVIPYPVTMARTESNYRDKPHWVRAQRDGWHGVDYAYHGALDFDTFYRRYAETLLALDESVGRVLDELVRIGVDSSTLVIYLGDNGFSLGEHGLIDKRHAYEESMRIPMLAWAPGYISPGETIEPLVRNIDIAPTMLELAGLAPDTAMDGRSVLPLFRGDSATWDSELLYEYYWEYAFPHTPTTFALRDGRYKYIYYHGVWDLSELYDLEADPDERVNLVAVPAQAERVLAMRHRLFDLLEATGGMKVPLRRGDWQAAERRVP
ncbi:MAG TPA: sulfatase [Gemmatimonadaceae bacterium]|nr:sulfatase [Gemmatimonadaceae bacterium]